MADATLPNVQAYAQTPQQHAPAPYSRLWALALLLADVGMLLLASYAATSISLQHYSSQITVRHVYVTTAVAIVVWLAIFARLGLYRWSFAQSYRDEFYTALVALCLGVTPLLVAFTIVPAISPSRFVVLLSLAFSIVTVGVTRAVAHSLREAIQRHQPRRIAIVGHPNRIVAAADSLRLTSGSSLLMLEVNDLDHSLEGVDFVRDVELHSVEWLHRALAWGCDDLILTEVLRPNVLPYVLRLAGRHRIMLAFAPPRLKVHAYQLSLQTVGDQALIVPSALRACRAYAKLLKRAMDLTAAASAIVIFAPAMLLAALAIRIDSPGPIFYRQERVGLNGRTFHIVKFRSMAVDAEVTTGPVWTPHRDPRVTRVGAFLRRTSLDELPQLFNVLLGEMSMVGPRPERPVFVERFRRELPRYDERHLVRPGITGWSHIHMPRNHDQSKIGQRLAYDLFYIEHWSLFMDVAALLKTAAEFLFQRAA